MKSEKVERIEPGASDAAALGSPLEACAPEGMCDCTGSVRLRERRGSVGLELILGCGGARLAGAACGRFLRVRARSCIWSRPEEGCAHARARREELR
eukprot:790307-Pleurochrysis_carterae.AAC.1